MPDPRGCALRSSLSPPSSSPLRGSSSRDWPLCSAMPASYCRHAAGFDPWPWGGCSPDSYASRTQHSRSFPPLRKCAPATTCSDPKGGGVGGCGRSAGGGLGTARPSRFPTEASASVPRPSFDPRLIDHRTAERALAALARARGGARRSEARAPAPSPDNARGLPRDGGLSALLAAAWDVMHGGGKARWTTSREREAVPGRRS
jgi:hypothetical protein